MDPATVIGVVSGLVALFDFATKLTKNALEIQQSGQMMAEKMSTLVRDMHSLRVRAGALESATDGGSPDDLKELEELANKIREIGAGLTQIIDKMDEAGKTGNPWDLIQKAWATLRAEEKLKSIQKALIAANKDVYDQYLKHSCFVPTVPCIALLCLHFLKLSGFLAASLMQPSHQRPIAELGLDDVRVGPSRTDYLHVVVAGCQAFQRFDEIKRRSMAYSPGGPHLRGWLWRSPCP